MANKTQDAKRASKKPAGKSYGGKHEKTAYQRERDAYNAQSKHQKHNGFPRGC